MSVYYKRSQWKLGSNGYGWTTFTVRNEDADAAEAALRGTGTAPEDYSRLTKFADHLSRAPAAAQLVKDGDDCAP